MLRSELSADCSVLMGANVANDMASDAFCETTIGYKDPANGELFRLAFDDYALKVRRATEHVDPGACVERMRRVCRAYATRVRRASMPFSGRVPAAVSVCIRPVACARCVRVHAACARCVCALRPVPLLGISCSWHLLLGALASAHAAVDACVLPCRVVRSQVGTVQDTVGVELCGALKNSVAIGAGFVDGLGMGGNTKAAIIRIGLKEMVKFCKMFYPHDGISDDTFLESCGVADLITTCYGGRNRKCAEAFAAAGKKKSLDEIEAELLGGQKLQGTLTAKEVNHILKMKGLEHEFPFFTTVYKISYEDTPLSAITETPY